MALGLRHSIFVVNGIAPGEGAIVCGDNTSGQLGLNQGANLGADKSAAGSAAAHICGSVCASPLILQRHRAHVRQVAVEDAAAAEGIRMASGSSAISAAALEEISGRGPPPSIATPHLLDDLRSEGALAAAAERVHGGHMYGRT